MNVRKIKQEDCSKEFETGYSPFDYDPSGERLSLEYYWELAKQGYEVYVIADERRVLAILSMRIDKKSVHFSRLGVHKDFHKMGYMSKMLELGRKRMEELKIQVATARVREDLIETMQDGFDFTVTEEGEDPHWGKYADMKLEIG